MQTSRTFPLNAWYIAAWSYEVGKREPLARTVCNNRMVLWRKADGALAVLEDACWHRQLPLSMGWLEGETLVCRYHGLGFDGKGRCNRMPSQETLNPAAKVRSYPALDRHRYVWVWPGDPALADPALVPDMHWNDDPEWAGDGKTLHAKCDYRLFVDNLLDLTHESFVHITSIGSKHVAETPMTTTHSGRTVTLTRWMLDIDAPPFWRAQLGKPGNVDRWRSSASKRLAPSCSTSAWRRPAPARLQATARRASTAACSIRSRRRPTPPACISGR
jgi:phenylpropionate dioxygenase-like ring-hydroxylating dioxygenase large terminal subunit